MKCPYAVNRKVISQTAFTHDDEGELTAQQTLEKNEASFVPCFEEDCGAWQDGRCRYRGND